MASISKLSPAMHHTMLRIADPARTLKFYEQHFGMKVLKTMPVPELGFTNYFLGLDGPSALHYGNTWYNREGVLELCHNHDAGDFVANNGNKEPHRGFGHICFSVPRLAETCESLEKNGVKFQKRLSDGRMNNIAFALDPDGYWIELIGNANTEAGPESTRFNHSMIRIKDPVKSLKFYTETLGMSLIDVSDNSAAGFKLYFLSYKLGNAEARSDREGIIELTHNFGTESDPDFSYHNGNDSPQGFGHFGITVTDVDAAVAEVEKAGYTIKKRKTDGKLKFVAFVLDPDGYWVELLPRAELPEKLLG